MYGTEADEINLFWGINMNNTQNMPETRIEMVHLQLTRRCNLNCWFCGQRKKDWSIQKQKEELQEREWMEVIDQLDSYARNTGRRPSVMIWGGEAALSPAFASVVDRLSRNGYRLGMITNGTLLDRQRERICCAFEKLYVSIDGNRELHDEIRGKGAFRKTAENMRLLGKTGPEQVIMTVLTKKVVEKLPEILQEFSALHPSEVILQDRIAMEPEEVKEYKRWFGNYFGKEAVDIEVWKGRAEDTRERETLSRSCREQIAGLKLPYKLTYLPHISRSRYSFCRSPFRHIHIGWNGNISFCTDFTDFSCGSVRGGPLLDLFAGERASVFRKEVMEGRCATCSHCSWRYKEDFYEL